MKDLVLGVVSQNFRPEFINRIDEVVVFHPLGEKHIASIAQIQLQRLYKRLEERGYEIHISDDALKLLSENGYDPVYGARPLKRAIQQQIETRWHSKSSLGSWFRAKLSVWKPTKTELWQCSKSQNAKRAACGSFCLKPKN